MAVNDSVEWQCRLGLIRRHSRSASPFSRATSTPDLPAYSTLGRSSGAEAAMRPSPARASSAGPKAAAYWRMCASLDRAEPAVSGPRSQN